MNANGHKSWTRFDVGDRVKTPLGEGELIGWHVARVWPMGQRPHDERFALVHVDGQDGNASVHPDLLEPVEQGGPQA